MASRTHSVPSPHKGKQITKEQAEVEVVGDTKLQNTGQFSQKTEAQRELQTFTSQKWGQRDPQAGLSEGAALTRLGPAEDPEPELMLLS
jgi:hypothetical protein